MRSTSYDVDPMKTLTLEKCFIGNGENESESKSWVKP